MNPKLLILLAFQVTCSGLFAQALAEAGDDSSEKIRYKLILPEEKTPEVVKPNEPNPFNKGDGIAIKADDSNSEENRVKDTLLAMRASGIVRDSADGSVRRVMLGGIPLERGMSVPPVLPDQEVALRVNSISDTTIELFWVEKKKHAGLPPRPVIIPMNFEPQVRYILPAPTSEPAATAATKEKGARSFGRQSSGLLAGPSDPKPARRAEKIPDEVAGPLAKPNETPNGEKKPDANHPANLLMNLLMNKSETTQKPAQ